MKLFIKRILQFIGLNRFIGSATHFALQQALTLYPDIIDELVVSQNQHKNNQLIEQLNLKDKGVHFNGKVYISHPLMVRIGKNVHIGNNAYFFTKGGLTIGDNSHLSRNVSIYTANHQYKGNALPYDDNYIEKPVFIGKNVWVGMNVSIVPGVTIGDGAIIGMGTVVSKDIAAREIVGSAPQNVLKTRDEKHYQKLINKEEFGGVNGKLIRKNEYRKIGKNASELGENLIFAVGTGRCGSTTLAKVLNQHPDIDFMHEPNGQLIKLSTDYAHGHINNIDVKNRLKLMYDQALTCKKIYGESDQKLSNLIELLHELYPKAKFIWLIRDPKETIISTYSRGWFQNSEFSYDTNENDFVPVYANSLYTLNRINGNKVGDFSLSDWKNMHPFERNCWYYWYWNKIINKMFVSDRNINYLKIDLTCDGNSLIKIKEFLGLAKHGLEIEKLNQAKYKTIENFGELENKLFSKWEKKLYEIYEY